MSKLAAAQGKLDRLKEETKKATQEKRDIIRRSLIRCTRCDKKSRLFSWAFIQDQYYVPPRSCSEGDYWLDSETACCHLVCPKCRGEIYIYNHPQRDGIVRLVDQHGFSASGLFCGVTRRQKR